MVYYKDDLKEYIDNSVKRTFSESMKVRLSKTLAEKYDNGEFKEYLGVMDEYLNEVKSLGISTPFNSNPFLYVYIVPLDEASKLLSIPRAFDTGVGGGKPVTCYDLDGYVSAYGVSENLASRKCDNMTVASEENSIHEMAHIIQSMYFTGKSMMGEGFAETVALFGLDYEDKFDSHRELIANLEERDIVSPKELVVEEREMMFGYKSLVPNSTCSFRASYVSSYLFVRGIVEKIMEDKNLSKGKALEEFLNIVRIAKHSGGEYLVFDIADALGMDKEELLLTKNLQLKVKESISKTKTK